MKAEIFDINGSKAGTLELPECFSAKIRRDLILRVLETKKTRQPYAPSPVAGKQHSASGRIVHRRHVWRSGYGRGMSRIPRKIVSRRGSQFNWIGAEVSSTVGGRRAHPPKVISMANSRKINKKELRMALDSAISASADKKSMTEKYSSLDEKNIKGLPIIVESKIASLKTKEFLGSLKKILGDKLFKIGIKEKAVRSGRGKMRGRRYKSNAGALIVLGKGERAKSNVLDSRNAANLGVADLAAGVPGRLVIYTEKAIREMGGGK
jgi:large subunit ribosomal protein L4e